MAEKIEKRIEEVCERMLFSARSELYLHLRFLDVALSMFSYALEPSWRQSEVTEESFIIILPIRGDLPTGKSDGKSCLFTYCVSLYFCASMERYQNP